MSFVVATISSSGPRSINEDEAVSWNLKYDQIFAAVADGLGGMGGGDAASQIAIQCCRQLIDDNMTLDKLRTVALSAHENIRAGQLTTNELSSMATTLTAGVFQRDLLIGVHCGDSRASIARGDGIVRLTSDHSEGERLFRAGKLTKEELFEYPRKNILDSALGVRTSPKIETFQINIRPGDKIFFTTDGVHEKVKLREMREIASRHQNPTSFVAEIEMEVKRRTAEDNYSIVAVFVM